MHEAVLDYVNKCLKIVSNNYIAATEHLRNLKELYVAEFGSMNVNGSCRHSFFSFADYLKVPCQYIGYDKHPGVGVDVLADLDTDIFLRGLADFVVSNGSLEHTAKPQGWVENAFQYLKPYGYCIMTMAADPFSPHNMHGAYGGPKVNEYYKSVAPMDLWSWFEDTLIPIVVDGIHCYHHEFQIKSFEYHPTGDLFIMAQKVPT